MTASARQSASAISAFKQCPMFYHLRYNKKLEPVEEATSLRMGTNWHRCLEILTMGPKAVCEDCAQLAKPDADCPLCEGTGFLPEDLQDALIRHIDQAYATVPVYIERDKWAVEKYTILYSALGWAWYWQRDEVKTIAREVSFKRDAGQGVTRVGRIDRFVRYQRRAMLGEYKSTSKPIDSGSAYWDGLRLDSQITLYLFEARELQRKGLLANYGLRADSPLLDGVLYDVWGKPTTKPKKLTLADAKKFLTGEAHTYYDTKMVVRIEYEAEGGLPTAIFVNGESARVIEGAAPKPTKKNPEPTPTYTIRETPEMYGIRLLDDITTNPEKYFARREIARTDRELERGDEEFHRIARVVRFMTMQKLWFTNQYQCNATFRCSFMPICTHGLIPEGDEIPNGFKRRGT